MRSGYRLLRVGVLFAVAFVLALPLLCVLALARGFVAFAGAFLAAALADTFLAVALAGAFAGLCLIAAWAAASRATGTRNGLHET